MAHFRLHTVCYICTWSVWHLGTSSFLQWTEGGGVPLVFSAASVNTVCKWPDFILIGRLKWILQTDVAWRLTDPLSDWRQWYKKPWRDNCSPFIHTRIFSFFLSLPLSLSPLPPFSHHPSLFSVSLVWGPLRVNISNLSAGISYSHHCNMFSDLLPELLPVLCVNEGTWLQHCVDLKSKKSSSQVTHTYWN